MFFIKVYFGLVCLKTWQVFTFSMLPIGLAEEYSMLVFYDDLSRQEFKDEGHCGKFGTETAFEDMTEYGILFECSAPTTTDPKKPTPLMTYWVIG